MTTGYESLENRKKTDMVFSWQNQPSEQDGCGIHTPSRGFGHRPSCGEFSVIRRHVSFRWFDGQKNAVWQLRESAAGLVRPPSPPDSRFAVRRYAGVPGVRGTPGALSKLWQSEARATGVFGGQPVLHQTFCLLCRAAVSDGNGAGYCQGTQTGLAHGERARQAVHEGATG